MSQQRETRPQSELGDSDVWLVLRAGRGNNVAHQWKPSLCTCSGSEEQRHKGAFVESLSSLSGGLHIDTVKESEFTTRRWKGTPLLCITQVYQREKGAFFVFLWLEISRESCSKQNIQCWCDTASFQCSIMHPNQNLHLWLVNHWRRSCRVCVCRQTGKRIHSSLFKPGKKNGIYICLYVCVHGWKLWQLTVYLYAFVWGVLFLEDKSTL